MILREILEEKNGTDVKTINPCRTLAEAANKLVAYKIGAMVVTDEDRNLTGIVSERDLIRAIAEYGSSLVDIAVGDVMTRTVITCAPEENIVDVLNLMNSHRIRHVLVVDGSKLVAVVSIRELTRACELLEIRANTDSLTGLSNRRHFLETLEMEFDRCHRYGHALSVAMIDVDHFKRINDTFGHGAGDEVLRAMSVLIVRELRPMDTVGRLGGEEFAAIFPETDMAGAEVACNRILAKIRALEVVVDDATISFTISVGLTTANLATQDPSGVLKKADELMYAAKSGGRNRLHVDASCEQRPIQEDMLQRARLGRQIGAILVRPDGDLI